MALGEQLRNARLKKNETTSQVAAATQMMAQIVEDIEREDFSRISAPIYAKGFIKLYARYVGLDSQPLIDEYVARFVHAPRPSLIKSEPVKRQATRARPAAVVERQEPATIAEAPKTTSPESRPRKEAALSPSPSVRSGEPAGPAVDLSGLRTMADDIAKAAGGAVRKGLNSLRGGTPPRDIHAALHQRRWYQNRPTGAFLKYVPVALGILLILIFVISSLSRIRVKSSNPEAVVPLNESKEEVHLVIDPPAPYLE
jgi:hypothetical protein